MHVKTKYKYLAILEVETKSGHVSTQEMPHETLQEAQAYIDSRKDMLVDGDEIIKEEIKPLE